MTSNQYSFAFWLGILLDQISEATAALENGSKDIIKKAQAGLRQFIKNSRDYVEGVPELDEIAFRVKTLLGIYMMMEVISKIIERSEHYRKALNKLSEAAQKAKKASQEIRLKTAKNAVDLLDKMIATAHALADKDEEEIKKAVIPLLQAAAKINEEAMG